MANHATTAEDRLTCIEHIVSARAASLEYLAAFHTLHEPVRGQPSLPARRTQALWMDTIVITKSDMMRYFEPHDTGLGIMMSSETASPGTPPPSPSSTGSSSGNGLRALSSANRPATVPSVWLSKNVPAWYALGYGLAALIVEPALSSGTQFIAAARELMLELDYQASVDHGSGPRRALAQRALRQDREERGVAMIRPAPSTAYVFNTGSRPAYGVPSYLRVAGSLLATLVLVYRKLMDPDIASDDSAYHRLVQFDTAVDTTVIQPIAKELERVAQRKLALDADAIFETFDQIAEPETGASPTPAKRVDPNAMPPDQKPPSSSKSSSWSSWLAKGVKSLKGGGTSPQQQSSSPPALGSSQAPQSLHTRNESFDSVAT